MADAQGLFGKLDAQLADVLAGWNLYSTILLVIALTFLTYPILTYKHPDVHPLLLSRQSHAAAIRNEGESAVYRSLHTPHGYPLRSGLAIKDPDSARWAPGRSGEIQDIWRKAVAGYTGEDGKPSGQRARVITVRGKEQIIEHSFDEISRQIIIIGERLRRHQRGGRVAIYLPNSLELLVSFFAAAFYGITPILLPYDQSLDTMINYLQATKPDVLVAAAGTLPLSGIAPLHQRLKEVIWVVRDGSRHMGFADDVKEHVPVSVWHQLVDETEIHNIELPPYDKDSRPTNVITIWQREKDEVGKIVEFTQQNIIAGVAALIFDLSPEQRFTPSDLFLPADVLTSIYPLTLTLAALFSNASVAINSVASPGSSLALATRSISPTVIVTSAATAAKYHETTSTSLSGPLQRIRRNLHARALAAGNMPRAPLLALAPPAANTTPGKLRLLFISERAGEDLQCPPLSSATLSDLRIATGARVIYALTAPTVAGAVAQTNVFDYRREEGAGEYSHFGPPLSSVEILLRDLDEHRTEDGGPPKGEILVRGPAVVEGTTSLGIAGTFRPDNTLAYL